MGWEFALAAFGAILLWGLQLRDKISDRQARRESTLVAIASEVQAICRLLRVEKYLERYHALADQVRAGTWAGESYVVDIRSNYTRVFEANAASLGELTPQQVFRIVSFYTYGQALIDGTKPDGTAVNSEEVADRAANIVALEGLIMAMLVLGDDIVQMPRVPLPPLAPYG